MPVFYPPPRPLRGRDRIFMHTIAPDPLPANAAIRADRRTMRAYIIPVRKNNCKRPVIMRSKTPVKSLLPFLHVAKIRREPYAITFRFFYNNIPAGIIGGE